MRWQAITDMAQSVAIIVLAFSVIRLAWCRLV
jgi:hypothetical protein